MKDEEKEKEQLIQELRDLRRRVAELEVFKTAHEPITAVRESLEKMQDEHDEGSYWTIFKNIPVGVYRTTPDDKFIMANQGLVDMLGYERVSDLLKIYVSDLYVDIEDRFNHLQKLLHAPTYFTEFRLRRKDGRIIWVRDYPRAISGIDGRIAYFDGVLVDITERKSIELLLTSRVVI